MKQRVLVNRILHFRYFGEVFQLKALHLKKAEGEDVSALRDARNLVCAPANFDPSGFPAFTPDASGHFPRLT